MVKALISAGYSASQIATIVHPFATGAERRRARNAIQKRIDLGEDRFSIVPDVLLSTVRAAEESGSMAAAEQLADLLVAERFVADGAGAIISIGSEESAIEAEIPAVTPAGHRGKHRAKRDDLDDEIDKALWSPAAGPSPYSCDPIAAPGGRKSQRRRGRAHRPKTSSKKR